MPVNAQTFLAQWVIYRAVEQAMRARMFQRTRALQTTARRLLGQLTSRRGAFGRQVAVVQTLVRGPATTEELLRRFGVSRRTLFRDLAALRRAGLPVYSDGTRFHLDRRRAEAILGPL